MQAVDGISLGGFPVMGAVGAASHNLDQLGNWLLGKFASLGDTSDLALGGLQVANFSKDLADAAHGLATGDMGDLVEGVLGITEEIIELSRQAAKDLGIDPEMADLTDSDGLGLSMSS